MESLNIVRKTFLEALLITALAVIVGITVNYLRPNGLHLFRTDCFKQTRVCKSRAESAGMVSVDEAAAFFFKNAAIFVDARSRVSYLLGHIPGALNLSAEALDSSIPDYLRGLSKNTMIIVYDDDVEGSISIDVANMLRNFGFKNVLVFPNGWTEWQSKGLPLEYGTLLDGNIIKE